MTQTRIRIGHVAIEGMPRMASGEAFGKRLEAAVAAAFRQPPAALRQAALSLPQIRLTLHHGASETDVALAVANALRDAVARAR